MYVVYKITRDDGQQYIGTTYKDGISKRMKAHSKTNRFEDRMFVYHILEESDDFDCIGDAEEHYIELYDTYYNGLNESINGKGNHLCHDFTTKDFKFSEESRKRMSESAKKRVERDGVPFRGCNHTDEQRERWSEQRKGVLPPNTKLDKSTVTQIISIFVSNPFIEGVGETMKNGRKMSYVRAFSLKYGKEYNVTPQQMERIIKGKVWKDVEREYKI